MSGEHGTELRRRMAGVLDLYALGGLALVDALDELELLQVAAAKERAEAEAQRAELLKALSLGRATT